MPDNVELRPQVGGVCRRPRSASRAMADNSVGGQSGGRKAPVDRDECPVASIWRAERGGLSSAGDGDLRAEPAASAAKTC